jgi:DNA-directed RNA polymerase subunit beta'
MTLKFLPVLPPDLRPIIKLQDNTIVTSDLNQLYQNTININNRINQLKKMQVSERFIKTEKIKLQNSIDELFSEEKKGKNKQKV